jgi:ABC-2 type transport system ATP-binding protein
MVLPDGLEIFELYQAAAQAQIQLRKLSFKRDSLEDIFLRAMEQDGGGLQT